MELPESEGSAADNSGQRAQRLWPVAAFTLTYLGVALIVGIVRGNFEFLFYIAVMLVLIGTVWVVHRYVGLNGAVLWGLSVWGLAHMAGGLIVVPEGWPVNADSRGHLYAPHFRLKGDLCV